MKRLFCLLTALLVALALPVTARAEHFNGQSNWVVTYTSGGDLDDNYSAQEYADQLQGLQPGDDITISVTLSHQNDTSADWYFSNEVIESLEAGKAEGSSYGYVLTYAGPSGEKTIYESTVVGGDGSNGLIDVNSGLKDYLFLDTLSKGQTATVKLVVTLDGETEGNAYFNTLGKLKMRFAVEPVTADKPKEDTPKKDTPTQSNTPTTSRTAVKTGEDDRLLPFYLAMVVSGVLLLALAVDGIRRSRRNRKERAQ